MTDVHQRAVERRWLLGGTIAAVNIVPWVVGGVLDDGTAALHPLYVLLALLFYALPGWAVRAAITQTAWRVARDRPPRATRFAIVVVAAATSFAFSWWSAEWSLWILFELVVVRVLDAGALVAFSERFARTVRSAGRPNWSS